VAGCWLQLDGWLVQHRRQPTNSSLPKNRKRKNIKSVAAAFGGAKEAEAPTEADAPPNRNQKIQHPA
jgi:hypothetical protein